MKKKNLLIKLAVLVAAMMCAHGASASEAYANYTPSDKTLTFYYDDQRSSRPGTTYDLNTGTNDARWDTDGTKSNVTKVVFASSFAAARPTTTYDWFYLMRNLESIKGIEYLKTSEVTNMGHMFNGCSKLMSLDVSHFNTSKVTDMRSMFRDCSALFSLDLSSFNTSKVTNMYGMFDGCSNLQTIYVGSGWSTAAVTNSTNMFKNCTSLVGGQGTTFDSSHTDVAYAHIDGGPNNPGYFTKDLNEPEVYACYTPSNTTLTFYYDNQRSSRTGTTYDLNTDHNLPGWISDDTNEDVTRVVFDPSFADVRPTTTCYWFHVMQNLQTIVGMKEYLNTSEVTDMTYMFTFCSGLTSLDLSRFDTSKVTNMSSMFSYCSRLASLDLRSFDTRKVTNMSSMFSFCSGLKSVNLLSFNTSQVTDMKYMFMDNQNLRTIYAGYAWSTAAVTSSLMMFYNCTSLVGGQGTTYDYIHYNKDYAHLDGGPSDPGYFTLAGTEAYACYTSWNTTLTFYFDGQRDSRPGTTYDLNEDDTGPGWEADGTNEFVTQVVFDSSFANARPTTTFDWFYNMRNLESITGMEYLNTSQVTNMGSMFSYCWQLTSLDLSTFNTSKVTNMRSMFSYCWRLRSLDLSSFNTSKVTNMMYMFQGCTHLITVYVGSGWSTAAVQFSTSMFSNCRCLVGGQGTTYDESNPVDKTYAHLDGGPSNPGYFTVAGTEAYACYTPSNTTLTFYYDTERSSRTGTTYDLNTDENSADWDRDGTYRNVTKVVFDPSFAIARPLTTFGWFGGMTNLESITGMNYLNTSEVTDMVFMFRDCSLLASLDLSHFDTSRVTNMVSMFYGCSSLTSLDLSSFQTYNVTNMGYMFYNCGNLQTIYANFYLWNTAAVTSSTSMFENCTSLVGGQGTTYNFNYIDKAYAHIDGGPSDPGYFTAPIEAYACYTPSNTTLTFYYDTERSKRPGTKYDLNTGPTDTGWGTDGTNANVRKVDFDPSFAGARPTTTFSWFYGMRNLQAITGIEYLNTSEVTDMAHMFNACSSLISLNVSGFNTSKVSSMESMFFGCSSLRTVYAGDGWNTTAVTSSTYMFKNCTSLVGGQGTTYDANHVDAAYAHIDGGPSNPGYFTDKNASLRGDVDGDGSVNISDVTALIDYLLSGNASGISLTGGDCDTDGNVNISDVTALIDYLLSGHW